MPLLSIVAGPNGSGKSTLTTSLGLRARSEVIDPDEIARTLNPADPLMASIPAARQAILRCRELIEKRLSFTLETTLAGNGAMALLKDAKAAGFHTRVVYVCLGDPDLQIDRVRWRAALGGHDVPDSDIRRRYERSLARAPEALKQAEKALVFDNSGLKYTRQLILRDGLITWQAPGCLPPWVRQIIDAL